MIKAAAIEMINKPKSCQSAGRLIRNRPGISMATNKIGIARKLHLESREALHLENHISYRLIGRHSS